VKKLAVSIDKLKAELSTSASSKQMAAAAASKNGSQITGSKVAGSDLVLPTKLVRTPALTSAEVAPSVTSSTADSTRADDKPTELPSPVEQVDYLTQLHIINF